jgi:predicted short-subunit dehydrogenase-like oxidoreductase (DUF2520 family)
MFTAVHVIGTGRAGGAIAARLEQAGVAVTTGPTPTADAELVIICVPDAAIAEVAAAIPPGPWLAHVSGATRLTALEPHRRRFSLHPLMTFTTERGAEQLDGAWGAVSGEDGEALARGFMLAEMLGLRPFVLEDEQRPLYHAGAVMAGNFLVTLYQAASQLATKAGAPPEALVPLMTRTIENGFALTGPIERGDWATVEAHLAAIEQHAPELLPLYRALAQATKR